ncbi:hypothetical protein EON81_10175 [bacterium]|nr:MAG: hypothetical protein EON81_10175 [bacterium]
MIIVFSTSSPVASIAAIEDGRTVFERSAEVRHRASESILGWYDELSPKRVEGFVADLGPGGFTGTRVAIVAAKTLAFALGTRCAGLPSFDFIDEGKAVVPARRGFYLTRNGMVEGWPEGGVGYGPDAPTSIHPLASRAVGQLDRLVWVEPDFLMPDYVLEPSISTPKKPYAVEVHARVE